MVQKAVDLKAKTDLKSSNMIQNLDARYLKSYCLSYNTLSKM